MVHPHHSVLLCVLLVVTTKLVVGSPTAHALVGHFGVRSHQSLHKYRNNSYLTLDFVDIAQSFASYSRTNLLMAKLEFRSVAHTHEPYVQGRRFTFPMPSIDHQQK